MRHYHLKVILLISAMLTFTLPGCDRRGENERAVDQEIAAVEHSGKSQADKDTAIILLDGLKTQARELDKQIANMTPEQRDAYERVKRMQGQTP